MTYQEFRETYKSVIKKFPETPYLFGNTNITKVKIEYEKRGSRWKQVKTETAIVDYVHYFNVFDAIWFFRNLGGYERTEMAYTTQGYIPIRQISISPDRTRKIVYEFKFN